MEFKKFIDSPFFGAEFPQRQLVQFLKKKYYYERRAFENLEEPTERARRKFKEYLEIELSDEKTWEFIYPDRVFRRELHNRNIHKANKLLEKFIQYQSVFSSSKASRDLGQHRNLSPGEINLLDIYIKTLQFHLNRGEIPLYNRLLKKCREILSAKSIHEEEWYKYNFLIEQKYNDACNRTPDSRDNYQSMSDNFDSYFILNKLKMYCSMQNRSHILECEYDYPLFDFISDQEIIKRVSYSPIFEMYRTVLVILSQLPSLDLFPSLWNQIEVYKDKISRPQLKQICMYSRNCLQFAKKYGKEDILFLNKRAFEVTIFMEINDLLLVNNKISDAQFIAAVKTGIANRENQWTQNFIDRFKGKIVGKYVEEAIAYSEACLAYAYGNPLGVWRRFSTLSQVSSKFKHLTFPVRCLELKVLFSLLDYDDPDLADPENLILRCKAFAKLISNDRTLSKSRKVRLKNFHELLWHLIKIKTKGEISDSEKTKFLELLHLTPTEDKEWFLGELKLI